MMIARLATAAQETVGDMRRRWRLVLAVALAASWVAGAIALSDLQGRMDLPRAYSVVMTCEDDPEAALWHGGCDRIASSIATKGTPSFGELYAAFVEVHHLPPPGERVRPEFAARDADPAFDLDAMLAGQRHGLAAVRPEFDGVRRGDHAEAIISAIDARDRALLVIGRAGLSFAALFAGTLANLVHPSAMIDGAVQFVQIQLGIAKTSDLSAR
jgi:uncharacterized membrane protein YhdT